MKTEQKKRLTRAEVVEAVAGVFRLERDQYHHMALKLQDAAREGEAAAYTTYEKAARDCEISMKAVERVAAALGITINELAEAANRNTKEAN